MQDYFKKYCFRILSPALIVIFLITNVSICRMLVTDCMSEETSCCCKEFSDKNPAPVMIEKSCCCEIKEATSQPAEITLVFSESKHQIPLYASNLHPARDIDLSSQIKFNVTASSFHSPPRENIYILNSNFRI